MQNKTKNLSDCLFAITVGNTQAIGKLYKLMFYRLFALIYNLVGKSDYIDDLIHDSIIHIVEKAKYYTSDDNALAWILKVVKNFCIDKIRKYKREREVPFDDETYDSGVRVGESDLVDYVLSRLSKQERYFVINCYFGRCKMKEIAEELKISLSYVYYIDKKLKRKLYEIYVEYQE